MADFRSLLPETRRSTQTASKARYTAPELKVLVAPAVLTECLRKSLRGFTTKDIYEAVPAVKAAYATPNALGTLLGQGVNGNGVGLWSRAGSFARCQENAVLAAAFITDEDMEALALELNFEGVEALVEAITSLPTI